MQNSIFWKNLLISSDFIFFGKFSGKFNGPQNFNFFYIFFEKIEEEEEENNKLPF